MRTHYQYTLSDEEFLRILRDNQSKQPKNVPGYPAIQGVPAILTVEEDGISVASPNGNATFFWRGIVSVEEHEGSISLFFENDLYFPIASAAFADAAEHDAFLAYVRERIAPVAIAPIPEADALAIPVPAPAPVTPPVSSLQQNIGNAVRFAFFARVTEEKMPVSWGQVVSFALLSMAAPVAWSLVALGGAGYWNWTSLPDATFHVPVLLFAAVLVAYVLLRVEKTLVLLQAFLMIAFAIDVIYYTLFFAFYRLPDGIDASPAFAVAYYGCAIWMALASAVAAMRLTSTNIAGATVNTRLVLLLISGLCIALPLSTIHRDRSLWEKDYRQEKDTAPVVRNDITSEDNFYRQPILLEQELAAVRPQRNGVTNAFFIGVAGYGNEDVFRREIDSVAKLFRERFDAEGHTIRLINNPKLAASAPIASVTSLRASLKRVAEVMDTEEDVLVLFLTSHGSETHRFSLELWPMQFKELDPLKLRSLLDESGIKHRVVVVSACYSGGFINALKNDDTLVITASAPDRNSFGCNNENDWTYFGRAYFDEALRKTFSFTEAFELAKPVIAEREKKEDFKPSNPQISVGKNISATLERLQAQLANPAIRTAAAEAAGKLQSPADAASQYAARRFDREFIAQSVKVCKSAAQSSGPEVIVAAQPDAYGGLNANSPLWPQLVGAWQRYIDDVCDRTSDPLMLQTMYAQFLREAATPQDVNAMQQFADTAAGTSRLKTEKITDLRMTAELARMQTEFQTRYYKTFLDEQKRIYAAFQKGAKARK